MKFDIQPGVLGIIFDLDGTLVDSMPAHFEAWKKAAGRYGAEVSTSFLQRIEGEPSYRISIELIKEYNLDSKVHYEKLLSEKVSEFAALQHTIKLIKPAVDIVKKYYGKLPLGLGTGGHRKAVERTLEIVNLTRYFDVIITADDIKNFKPDPETFLLCSRKMKINPSEIEVFEDTDQGIEAAINAGMKITDVRTWRLKSPSRSF